MEHQSENESSCDHGPDVFIEYVKREDANVMPEVIGGFYDLLAYTQGATRSLSDEIDVSLK